MPVRITKKNHKFEVRTPGGIKSKSTTLAKAKKQERLLQAIEHGFVPTKNRGVQKRRHQ